MMPICRGFYIYNMLPFLSPWFLVGNGGMDPSASPFWSPIVDPISHSPIPFLSPRGYLSSIPLNPKP